jgi:hypothetical protein
MLHAHGLGMDVAVSAEAARIAERELSRVLERPDVDAWRRRCPWVTGSLDSAVEEALTAAYGDQPGDPTAHRLLHRILYRINRLMLFWYDDLRAYENERSPYVLALRNESRRRGTHGSAQRMTRAISVVSTWPPGCGHAQRAT